MTTPTNPPRAVPVRILREIAGAILLIAGLVTLGTTAFMAHPLLGSALVGVSLVAAGVSLGRSRGRGDR